MSQVLALGSGPLQASLGTLDEPVLHLLLVDNRIEVRGSDPHRFALFANGALELIGSPIAGRLGWLHMNLTIRKDEFENLIEIWGIGPTSVEVVTKDHRHFRVTAARNIRSGAEPQYFAQYEQLHTVTVDGMERQLWGATSFPWQDGATIDECIRLALVWVDEKFADEHR